jgi:choline-phosphate cytidylyltransferase
MVPNCYLIVGVCSDKDIEDNKGTSVMNEVERVESVRHCKWVDQIYFPAPWSPTIDFLDSIEADVIAHDTIPYQTN